MTKMKNRITILLLLSTLCVYGQAPFDQSNISKATNKAVKKIEQVNMLMGSAVGYAGERPKQYDNFEKLKEKASTEELKALTNHPNPTVRCYAFWALSHDHSVDLFPIIMDHINDDEMVSTQFGCIGYAQQVGDFFIGVVTPNLIDLDSKKLDSLQLVTRDSILIYTSNETYAKSVAIRNAEPTAQLYPKLRALVTAHNDQEALVSLAKYQKEQDIELILNNRAESPFKEGGFFHTYRAISHFPHPHFLPLLEKNLQKTLNNTHYSTEWRELYKAIASYKNDKAVSLLQVPFTKVKHEDMKPYQLKFAYGAIQAFSAPIYDDLFWQFWAEEQMITPDIFEYLSGIAPEKAYALTKESLEQAGVFHLAVSTLIDEDYDAPEQLTVTMLNLVLEKDKAYGIEIIRKNLKTVHMHIFPVFADKAAELKDQSFIAPLFERLETADNGHVFFNAAKALIAYQNAEINQRILDTKMINPELNEGWGGKALDELLEEHGIN